MNTGHSARTHIALLALWLGCSSCTAVARSSAGAGQDDLRAVREGHDDWRGLARAALAAIDWSRVCDRDVVCSVVRVDSIVREVARLTVPRSATHQIAVLHLSDLPAVGVRYLLGERDYVDRGEDAILTMVVVARPHVPEWYPSAEFEVSLLRPRRDVVLISIKADYVDGSWIVQSIQYVES